MNVYLISYDLNSPGQNYTSLIDYIKRYTHLHLQKSVWIVKSSKDVYTLRNELASKIDANDDVIVIELQRHGWAAHNLPDFSYLFDN